MRAACSDARREGRPTIGINGALGTFRFDRLRFLLAESNYDKGVFATGKLTLYRLSRHCHQTIKHFKLFDLMKNICLAALANDRFVTCSRVHQVS